MSGDIRIPFQNNVAYKLKVDSVSTRSSAIVEGPRDALSVEILSNAA